MFNASISMAQAKAPLAGLVRQADPNQTEVEAAPSSRKQVGPEKDSEMSTPKPPSAEASCQIHSLVPVWHAPDSIQDRHKQAVAVGADSHGLQRGHAPKRGV